jgi:hypothetical protein
LPKQLNVAPSIPLSLKPDERLSEALVMTSNPQILAELHAIQDEFHFSRRNLPVRIVDSRQHPVFDREGEVTFEY